MANTAGSPAIAKAPIVALSGIQLGNRRRAHSSCRCSWRARCRRCSISSAGGFLDSMTWSARQIDAAREANAPHAAHLDKCERRARPAKRWSSPSSSHDTASRASSHATSNALPRSRVNLYGGRVNLYGGRVSRLRRVIPPAWVRLSRRVTRLHRGCGEAFLLRRSSRLTGWRNRTLC